MSTAIAKNLMAEMKLFGMLAAYDQVITDATRDQLLRLVARSATLTLSAS